MRGVNFWRGACLALCLCVAAGVTMGQTVPPGNITSNVLAAATSGGIITLRGEGEYLLDFLLPISLVGKTLTIKSDGSAQPQLVRVRGISAGTLVQITGGTLVLEGITLESQARCILLSAGATLKMNRCLVRDSGAEGVAVDGGTAYIANSCFSGTAGPALALLNGSAVIGLSTFIDCGAGVEVQDGGATVVMSIFYRNSGPGLSQTSGNLVVSHSLYEANGGPDTVNITDRILLPEKFNIGVSGIWPGDIPENEGIEIKSQVSLYPPELLEFQHHDFEGEPRGTLQVGADWEDPLDLDMIWLDTEYRYDLTDTIGEYPGDDLIYVGNGGTVEVWIEGNPGNIDFIGDFVRIVPQSGNLASDRFIELPLTRDTSATELWGRAELTVTGTEMNGVVMDGLATVYLVVDRNTPTEEVFGDGLLNSNPLDGRVHADALVHSKLLFIDTIAPRLRLENTDPAQAPELYYGSSDTQTAGTDVFPPNWRPASVAVPWNDAVLTENVESTVIPKLFFNTFGDNEADLENSFLTINIGARFIDEPAANSGALPSGFDDPRRVSRSGTVADVLAPVAPTADEPSPLVAPYWAGDFLGRALFPDDPVEVLFEPDGVAGLNAVWTLRIPEIRARNNDWHMRLNVVASDRARNQSVLADVKPLELWWMQYARAELTSRFNGAAVPVPQLTWKLFRAGQAPSDVSPCEPLFRYRIWSADLGGGWKNATWQALDSWSDWISGTGVTLPTSVLNATLNRRLLVTIVGADEAGNVQPAGVADGDSIEGVAVLDENGIQYDHWLNLGLTGTVDTTLSTRIWYYDTDLDEPEAFLRDFGGSGAQVPDPDSNRVIVLAQFDIGVQASQGARRRVVLEISGTTDQGATNDLGPFTAVLAPGQKGEVTIFVAQNRRNAPFALPAGVNAITYFVRARAEMDANNPGGGEVTIIDDSPATMSFTVYDEVAATAAAQESGMEEQTGEQPFKVYVRGAE